MTQEPLQPQPVETVSEQPPDEALSFLTAAEVTEWRVKYLGALIQAAAGGAQWAAREAEAILSTGQWFPPRPR